MRLVVLLLLSSLAMLEAVSVVARQPLDDTALPDPDDYVLDHEVTLQEAFTNARSLQLYPGPRPGCNTCTKKEMTYCQDGSVLHDHCCCDGVSNDDALRFVEHKCLMGPEVCQVRAENCDVYSRVLDCCCHPYLASHWKELAGNASPKVTFSFAGMSLLLALIGAIR